MKTIGALAIALCLATPAAAQRPGLTLGTAPAMSLRPYVMFSGQQFSAKDTFTAAFGSTRGLFWGGGIEVDLSHGLFADAAVSRFKKTGERAFIFDGETIPLDVGLTATVTPLELTVGYRVRLRQRGRLLPIVPYLGLGVGSYGYHETSDLSDAADDVDIRHSGVLFVAGADVRVHRLASISVDVQGTRVSGILGAGGLSQQVGEDDLGGVAARLRILIGRGSN